MVKLVLKQADSPDFISFIKPSAEYMNRVNSLLASCREKNNGYVTVTLDRPHRPRTTGEGSQNNLFWQLVKYICMETGSSKDEVEQGIKERAVFERGYPTHINPITHKEVPDSMTVIDTVEMSKLIEEAQLICAELGINVPTV